MSFSYDTNLDTSLNLVRFYLGDTVQATAKLTDEEITAYLVIQSVPILCAAEMADALAGRASKVTSRSIGGLSISMDERTFYEGLAERLRKQYRQRPQAPFMGGKTHSQKRTVLDDTDLIDPYFGANMDENLGSTTNTEDDG